MRVDSTYGSINQGNSEMAEFAQGNSGRVERGIWLSVLFAFLSVGLTTWVWINNDTIIAWGLSQGLVDEGATRFLPGAVRNAAIVGGILGLIAASLALRPVQLGTITILGHLRRGINSGLGYIRIGVAPIAEAVAHLLTAMWLGAAVVARVVTVALGSLELGVVNVLVLGAFATVQAVGLVSGYLRRRINSGLGYVRMGVAPIAEAVALVLTATWLGVSAVARVVILALGSLGLGVVNILVLGAFAFAQALALVLGYLRGGISSGLGYVAMGVARVAGAVALVLTATWLGVSAVARVVILALGSLGLGVVNILVLGAFAFAQALALVLGYLRGGISSGLGYVAMGVARVAGAVALVLTATWLRAAAVARVVSLALVSGYLRQATNSALGYGWQGIATGLAYTVAGIAIAAEGLSQARRHMWMGTASVAQFVAWVAACAWLPMASVLSYMRTGIAIIGQGVVGLLRLGVSTLGHPLWVGTVMILRLMGLGISTTALSLARIHRRTALGTAPEEARGCSSESGIMVLEQKPARKQGAPNRCCHRTNPTVSASSLTTIAWWPMPACSCRPPSPGTWACENSSTITLTSAERRDGRTLGTRC